jgi:hypothetical protein
MEIALLDAGDIIVHDLGIERKTIDDFFRTLTAGQLFPQLRKLKRAFRRQMLSSTVASGVVAVCPLWGAHLLRYCRKGLAEPALGEDTIGNDLFSTEPPMMKKSLVLSSIAFLLVLHATPAHSQACSSLPRGIKVLASTQECGNNPAVVLTGAWRSIFSAAFRWDNNGELEDRSPYALDDGSAASSPYKTQRVIRRASKRTLCYGNFVRNTRFPLPLQLTVKRTAAPVLNRYCVSFSR